VNLAMPDSVNAISDEGSIVTSLDMVYIHIPVPFDAPTADHLMMFLNVMDTFPDQKIWVHCAVNKRASAFITHYLQIFRNLDETAARTFLLPGWTPDPVWRNFLQIKL
jgi:protein tyrosine phosphatase (PTP) superfamily phosphohydrolase (DUF442 family)